jgi:predicted transcriptional regulator
LDAPRLSKLEFQIMEALWGKDTAEQRELSIREILDALPGKRRPAYTTIQTTIYRMEAKGVVRRVKKVGNFHVFAAAISRNAAQRRMIDELLALFGGRPQPVMAHLVETGKLTLEDVQDAEKLLRKLSRKEKQP